MELSLSTLLRRFTADGVLGFRRRPRLLNPKPKACLANVSLVIRCSYYSGPIIYDFFPIQLLVQPNQNKAEKSSHENGYYGGRAIDTHRNNYSI
jgi:hypothetical protein